VANETSTPFVPFEVQCPECGGSGHFDEDDRCEMCGGLGWFYSYDDGKKMVENKIIAPKSLKILDCSVRCVEDNIYNKWSLDAYLLDIEFRELKSKDPALVDSDGWVTCAGKKTHYTGNTPEDVVSKIESDILPKLSILINFLAKENKV
jgi:hypothetical protein